MLNKLCDITENKDHSSVFNKSIFLNGKQQIKPGTYVASAGVAY